MIIITDETKLGKFWDLSQFKNKEQLLQNPKIAQINEMNQLAKNKVYANEWTEKEYSDFCSVIKQMTMANFSIIYVITKKILELSNSELKTEINYLISNQIIIKRKETDTLHKLAGYAVSDMKSKTIQHIKRATDLTTIRDYSNIDKNISSTEAILQQLDDNSSQFNILIREIYKEYIESTFKNSKLKQMLFSLEDIILEFVIKDYRRTLNSLIYAKDRRKIGETLDAPTKYKSERAMKNKNHYKIYCRH